MGLKKLLAKLKLKRAKASDPAPDQPTSVNEEAITRCNDATVMLPPPRPRITRCRWSRDAVEPVHGFQWPHEPNAPIELDRIRAPIDVRTEGVDDGTLVVIAVHHVAIEDADVSRACPQGQRPDPDVALLDPDGRLTHLAVQDNRVVDTRTGAPPYFEFDERQVLWSAWRKPFYELRVTVQAQPQALAATSSEFDSTLRLRGWHVMVADMSEYTKPTLFYNNVDEALAIHAEVTGEHRATVAGTVSNEVPLEQWGQMFRNAYAVLNVSHGYVYERRVPLSCTAVYEGVPEPLRSRDGRMERDAHWAPAEEDWPELRSVMRYGSPGNPLYKKPTSSNISARDLSTRFGDESFQDLQAVPSTPRYLWMMSSCRTMAEPSLADALHARGTWFVIGWVFAAAAHECRNAEVGFYADWAAAQYDPDAVPELFRTHFLTKFAARRPLLSIAPAVALALDEDARIAAALDLALESMEGKHQ